MIKVLSQNLINQIAAGEVIERPASVIKELVENAIDAGATEVEVRLQDAGKSLISVSDNGFGMDKDSLELCVLSHATSKLSDENLFNIHTFGFRGEALPSMVSIARVSIVSSDNESGEAWRLNAEGKENLGLEPDSRTKGTTVTVRDLFYATPARLKFLKSDTTENEACQQTLKRIALSFRNVSFSFYDKDKKKFSYGAAENLKQRITDVFGEEFVENLFEVKIERGQYSLCGFIGVPTFNKPSSNYQYFFVNNRFVKDKIFSLALRSAYSGLVHPGRYPVAILFLNMPHDEVDVNAHPAKTEVRFKEVEMVRGFLISSLKKLITSFGSSKPSAEIVNDMFSKMNPMESNEKKSQDKANPSGSGNTESESPNVSAISSSVLNDSETAPSWNVSQNRGVSQRGFLNYENKQKLYNSGIFAPQRSNASSGRNFTVSSQNRPLRDFSGAYKTPGTEIRSEQSKLPEISDGFSGEAAANSVSSEKGGISFGTALCQIANTYIVASNGDNLILIDQHAVAERITLEKLKKTTKLDSQNLLLPEICPLSEVQVELFEKNSELIAKFGIVYEKLSSDVIVVNALPSILGSCEAKPLINDVADELENMGDIYSLDEKIHLILSTVSCHGSLRAGRKLSIEEMNNLLRQMESTENIAQCCHGRPSFVVLTEKNLNKFFERT
ncbi:MAG: DNA mismatch repair endonuclease MutL [Alphaproteobacteria bacterium]|nr:DNA mismatch repair endonuclease MutL [Alphaproteobacteria bacterium]